jgi:tetratricopeptide (TPR) repeat protein
MTPRATAFRLALVLLGLGVGRTAWSQNFSQLLERGIQLQQVGRHREALAAYEAALRIGNPGDVNYEIACANLGQVYSALGQLDRAEAMLTQVLAKRQARLDPNHEMIGKVLGDLSAVYYRQGKLDQAIGAQRRQVEIYRRHYPIEHPRMLTAVEFLTNTYREVNNAGQAEALLHETIQQLEGRSGMSKRSCAIAESAAALRAGILRGQPAAGAHAELARRWHRYRFGCTGNGLARYGAGRAQRLRNGRRPA